MSAVQTANEGQAHLMDRMYRYQRYIYDFTRKYYLFGRDTLIRELNPPPGASVLEVGCGTGRNLAVSGNSTPVRASSASISRPRCWRPPKPSSGAKIGPTQCCGSPTRRISLPPPSIRKASTGSSSPTRFPWVPEWEQAVDAAIAALKPGGSLHIVDFGQQEGWAGRLRRLLQAWLGRFHVTRANRFSTRCAKGREKRSGARDQIARRGYAWLAVYRRAAP